MTTDTETDVERDARVAEFTATYAAAIGVTPTLIEVEGLLAAGLPAHLLPVLGAMVDHAVGCWGTDRDEDGVWSNRYVATELLLSVARGYTESGTLTEAQMVGWLALIAGASSYEAGHDMASRVGALRLGVDTHPNAWWLPWAQMPGDAGALAWAAGLSADEAWERQHAGTLMRQDLLVLATLRGWMFPPSS